jgi:phosphatidylserine/phosphatidylglycerophosphate/cardiolipin synthase-like enzyme
VKSLAFAFALLFAAPALAAEIHYAPGENLEAIDVGLIDAARERIDIAVYGFTSAPVMNALAEAGLRGVKVRIYRDRTQHPHGFAAEAAAILEETPNIEIRMKKTGPIMHLKAYAVDGKVLRSGSANFTRSGLRRQDNDLIVDRDPADVAAFEADFNAMWER